MLLACWRRSGADSAREIWAAIQHWVQRAGLPRIESPDGVVAAAMPARLERRGEEGIAWLYPSGPAASGIEPSGPDLRLTRHALTATSGPVPQYPLYYYRSADDAFLVVCSQLGPLAKLLPTGGLNMSRVVQLACWEGSGIDPGATVYRNFRRILACERIEASNGVVRSLRHVPRVGAEYLRAPPEELAAELRARIDASVSRAMENAGRVAVFAGGGLDSSGLLALAVAQCRGARKRDLEAIAAVWASPGDDRPHLATLERSLGMTAVRIGAREASPWVMPSLCTDSQPQPSPAACFDMLLWTTATQRGADVALAGHAGDYVLGGVVSFAALAARGHPVRAARHALALEMPGSLTPQRRIGHWVVAPLLRPYVPRRLWTRIQRRRNGAPWMRPRFLKYLDECIAATPRTEPRTPDEWLAHFCTRPTFAELSVSWGQIASVAPAAVVDVYRDLDLLRFVSQIDPVHLSDGHMFRGLYRRAMKGVLPESIRLRQDKALAAPAVSEAILGSGAQQQLIDLASLDALASHDLVDPEAFQPTFRSWMEVVRQGERCQPDPRDRSWYKVWQLLSVEAFMRLCGGRAS